jgi:hypothetical protein
MLFTFSRPPAVPSSRWSPKQPGLRSPNTEACARPGYRSAGTTGPQFTGACHQQSHFSRKTQATGPACLSRSRPRYGRGPQGNDFAAGEWGRHVTRRAFSSHIGLRLIRSSNCRARRGLFLTAHDFVETALAFRAEPHRCRNMIHPLASAQILPFCSAALCLARPGFWLI